MLKRCLRNLTSLNNRSMSTKKRKYPINLDKEKELPVFEYGTSKSTYRRVFVFGNIQTGALGVPYLKKKTDKPEILECLKYPKRLTFAEKHSVTKVAAGFGFTAFAVESDTNVKLYGSGLNTDAQIGHHAIRAGHPLEIIYFPQPIALPFQNPTNTNIKQLSAGRAHLAVLTDAEGLYLLGNNSYGQCGREIIPDENYAQSNYINHIPHLNSDRIAAVECGQDHTFALTASGALFACGWGADGQTGLHTYANTSNFTQVDLHGAKIAKIASRSDFALALTDQGQVFGWGNAEYDQIKTEDGQQQVCQPIHLEHLDRLGRISDIATGGSFCVVVNENGQVFSWGYGILGTGPTTHQSASPVHLPETLFGKSDYQPGAKVVKLVCGLSYAMAVTNFGDVYAWGRNTRACLGLGDEKDQFFPLKVSLGGYAEDVACGVDHTVVVCNPFV